MSATTRRRPSSSYGRDSRQGSRQSSRAEGQRGGGSRCGQPPDGDKSPAQRRAEKVESHATNTERHIVRAVATGSRHTGSRQSRQPSAGRRAKGSSSGGRPDDGDSSLLSANTSSVTQRMGRLGMGGGHGNPSLSPHSPGGQRAPMLQASMDSNSGWPHEHSPRIRHGPPLSPKEIRDSDKGKLASMKRHVDPLPRRH